MWGCGSDTYALEKRPAVYSLNTVMKRLTYVGLVEIFRLLECYKFCAYSILLMGNESECCYRENLLCRK